MVYEYLEMDDLPGCCGVKVFYEFPALDGLNKEVRADKIEEAIDDLAMSKVNTIGGSKLNMISLIDEQLKEGWLGVIRKLGYRRIARFKNTSGNIVNVYILLDPKNKPPAYAGKPKVKKVKAAPIWGR